MKKRNQSINQILIFLLFAPGLQAQEWWYMDTLPWLYSSADGWNYAYNLDTSSYVYYTQEDAWERFSQRTHNSDWWYASLSPWYYSTNYGWIYVYSDNGNIGLFNATTDIYRLPGQGISNDNSTDDGTTDDTDSGSDDADDGSSDSDDDGTTDDIDNDDGTGNDDTDPDDGSGSDGDTDSDDGSDSDDDTVISSYTVVDTDQIETYNNMTTIAAPAEGEAFYGQDSQFDGTQASYTKQSDGTVIDNITELQWYGTTDTDGDGDIDADDKLTPAEAESYVDYLNSIEFGGYDDWRLPTIKELYSLILFDGTDPSGLAGNDTSELVPFIDDTVFDFDYGDTDAGERIIDSQYISTTYYVDESDDELLFGVNFADGRIKGYGVILHGSYKTFFVMPVRGNDYGVNEFIDNNDSTITDEATGLMWSQEDSVDTYNWKQALAYVQTLNESEYLGYSDWRLPNVKELQSIVDYTRSPGTTGSAAINPLFNCTSIINEGGVSDYGYYWSGTTHLKYTGAGDNASYVAFGRGLGYMDGAWQDVHGAGCQRSDPKAGDPDDYPEGNGPQGDAIRIYNFVRVVRDAE